MTQSGGHEVLWGNTDAKGNFTITDTPTVAGTYYYTATYPGYALDVPGTTPGNGATPGWAVATVTVARKRALS